MPSPEELLALFGDDFEDVLKGLAQLPPEARELLEGTMNKMLYDADIFDSRVIKAVQTQGASGMSAAAISAGLANDMATGGPVFGEIRNTIKGSLVEGINQTGRAGSFEAYDADDKTLFMWVTVAGHKVCLDCAPRGGQEKTFKEWEQEGMPGSGWSVCKGYCYCILDSSGKISPRLQMEARDAKKIQEKGATIRPKKPAVAPTLKSTGKTTYTDFEKGENGIESYFKNQEMIKPENIQLMEAYSGSKYHGFNVVGRKWGNDIALNNNMLLRGTTVFEKTRKNNKGNVFRVTGADGWKEKFTKLKTFLNKTPNYEGTSYRSVGFSDKVDLDSFLKRFKKDSIVESNSFWSTSADKRMGQSFGSGDYKVTITIEGKTGTILNGYSEFAMEKEILFNAGTKFRVKSVGKLVSKADDQVLNLVIEEI